MRGFRKELDRHVRDKKLGQAQAAVVRPAGPPLATIAATSFPDGLNVSTSVYEAKAGVRASLSGFSTNSDPVQSLSANPKAKKMKKDMVGHLVSHTSGGKRVTDPALAKKMMKDLKVAFDPVLFSKIPLPNAASGTADTAGWASRVYEFEAFGHAPGFVSVGFPHFCCMENRLILEGNETVLGIPIEECPGATLKEKRKHLFLLTIDDLRNLVKESGGFSATYDNTKLLTLPTGFVLITTSTAETHGFRWSVSGDEQCTSRTKSMLKEIMSSFPEMGNSSVGYQQFFDWVAAS